MGTRHLYNCIYGDDDDNNYLLFILLIGADIGEERCEIVLFNRGDYIIYEGIPLTLCLYKNFIINLFKKQLRQRLTNNMMTFIRAGDENGRVSDVLGSHILFSPLCLASERGLGYSLPLTVPNSTSELYSNLTFFLTLT